MKKLSYTEDGMFKPFSLNDDVKEFKEDFDVPRWAAPYLSTTKAWDNYSDELVYEVDKRMRKWLKENKSRWTKRKATDRRFTMAEILKLIGLDVDPRGKNLIRVKHVIAYYSTKIQKRLIINGVRKKTVYTVSPRRLERQPYSLKLRIELMGDEEGTWRELRVPKDNLEPGHARNPRTEANMRRREEIGRKNWNEYQRKRKAAREAAKREASRHRPVHDDNMSDEDNGRSGEVEGSSN